MDILVFFVMVSAWALPWCLYLDERIRARRTLKQLEKRIAELEECVYDDPDDPGDPEEDVISEQPANIIDMKQKAA